MRHMLSVLGEGHLKQASSSRISGRRAADGASIVQHVAEVEAAAAGGADEPACR